VHDVLLVRGGEGGRNLGAHPQHARHRQRALLQLLGQRGAVSSSMTM
jgi:hypothetical protein